ncbi:helix-turn-helix transcriptional regulator [Rhodococcus ruber]|uniref:helix-turn-helix transcriptional regulator n=1 Tax=Rhodococcus ruber TaxID=1830 RepID=UPI000A9C46DD|nr:LuxR C-terminal-related transcriptional regulator [Rhodococcus ruber]
MNIGDAELDRAISDILTDMRTATPERATELGRRLVDLLDRRKAFAEKRSAEIGALASGIDRAVHALDDAASSAELMRRACERVAELCSARKVLLSRLEGDRIVPVISFSTDPGTSPSLPPGFDLVPGSPEAHALATNTVTVDEVVAESFRDILGDNGFSTVPVVVDGNATALVHVDTVLDGPRRHALSVFAEMLGGCFERVGLESRRERQDLLLRESARRWGSDTDFDALPPRDTPDSAPSHTEHDDVDRRLLDPLTEREADVVRLILTGASNAAIAAELVITVDTVKSHVKRILRKLGATNRAELIAKYQSTPR